MKFIDIIKITKCQICSGKIKKTFVDDYFVIECLDYSCCIFNTPSYAGYSSLYSFDIKLNKHS